MYGYLLNILNIEIKAHIAWKEVLCKKSHLRFSVKSMFPKKKNYNNFLHFLQTK